MTPRSRLVGSSRPRLTALLDGTVIGLVYQSGNGKLVFQYAEAWRENATAHPLSLSMPLSATEHGDAATRAFLRGLLPDNPDVIRWWARRYGVSPLRVVDLLTHMGEDCAGAIQFAAPDRASELTGAPNEYSVEWLTDDDVRDRLRDLRLNPAAGRIAGDHGQFSLAGAQPKTALYQNAAGAFGVPYGRTPTNCILKPPTLGLDSLEYNEHLCLQLARQLGIPAASSTVRRFGDEVAIVVERYDRVELNGKLVRIHQEDLCQAQSILPERKYESDGGPGIEAIGNLLRDYSTEPERDVRMFLDAITLNWLIAATDGHAKNFSILHAAGPQLRLAPLYDVISVLPNPHLMRGDNRLAMGVAGERSIVRITGAHWRTLAATLSVEGDEMMERIRALAVEIPMALERILAARAHENDARATIDRFAARLAEHSATRVSTL